MVTPFALGTNAPIEWDVDPQIEYGEGMRLFFRRITYQLAIPAMVNIQAVVPYAGGGSDLRLKAFFVRNTTSEVHSEFSTGEGPEDTIVIAGNFRMEDGDYYELYTDRISGTLGSPMTIANGPMWSYQLVTLLE